MRIGFIGLGIMGGRMATNLQRHDHQLVVFNRTPEKAKFLIDQGAVWGMTPATVASQVDVLFTMLANPEAVKEAALGEEGFLNHLRAGSLWVDCSTVNPSFSRQMATETQARQIRFLDAPVSGSKGPAANGELMFMVGGAESDFRACRSLLECMGSKVVHVGGHGQGTSLKMVINLLIGGGYGRICRRDDFGQVTGDLARDAVWNSAGRAGGCAFSRNQERENRKRKIRSGISTPLDAKGFATGGSYRIRNGRRPAPGESDERDLQVSHAPG